MRVVYVWELGQSSCRTAVSPYEVTTIVAYVHRDFTQTRTNYIIITPKELNPLDIFLRLPLPFFRLRSHSVKGVYEILDLRRYLCYPYSDWLRFRLSGILTPVCARFSAHVPTFPAAQPAFCIMGNMSHYRAQSDWGVALTTYPHLARGLKKGQDYTSARLWFFCDMLES